MAVKTLKNINPKNKRVIVRVDYNVPLKDGKITNNKRIEASLPTLKYLLDHGAAIILLSHLGRVEKLEDITSNKKSLAPVFAELKRLLPKVNVKFCKSSTGSLVDNAVKELKPGEILLLENTRYNDVDEKGNVTNRESKCDNSLGKYWASLGQVFVNDAFGTAHRKAASNYGIAKNIEESCIGYLIQLELENLDRIVQKPEKPVVAILGGSKVSDKLAIIKNLLKVADKILICGGMANTFLTAKGFNLGNSLVETSMIDTAKEILASDKRKKIVLPVDFLCAKEFKNEPKIKPIERQIGDNFAGLMALDVGTKTIADFQKQLTGAKTIFWNGPAGVFEFDHFQHGTKAICEILKKLTKNGSYTLIGGGDSAAAALNLGFKESDFSFISTGGGASLEYIEGKDLPGVSSIQKR